MIPHMNSFADGILVRKILTREIFIDHHHRGRFFVVVGVKKSPAEQRYPHRVQIVRVRVIERAIVSFRLVRGLRLSFQPERQLVVSTASATRRPSATPLPCRESLLNRSSTNVSERGSSGVAPSEGDSVTPKVNTLCRIKSWIHAPQSPPGCESSAPHRPKAPVPSPSRSPRKRPAPDRAPLAPRPLSRNVPCTIRLCGLQRRRQAKQHSCQQ